VTPFTMNSKMKKSSLFSRMTSFRRTMLAWFSFRRGLHKRPTKANRTKLNHTESDQTRPDERGITCSSFRRTMLAWLSLRRDWGQQHKKETHARQGEGIQGLRAGV